MSEPTPAISVVVLAYNSRSRIDIPLQSLRAQDVIEPWEMIVVESGDDGCPDYVRATYPEATVITSRKRLRPGGARNRGILAARAPHVAFLADDAAARPDWLRRRLALHREGFLAVGGAVTNGTPRSLVGTADYLLEYSAMMPSAQLLSEQAIPHSLSYSRDLFERLGAFPEDVLAGEDTVFNRRCVELKAPIAIDDQIQVAHRNLTRLAPYLRHQYGHGRGLVQCSDQHGLGSADRFSELRSRVLARRLWIDYPWSRWRRALGRIRRGPRGRYPAFIALSPLIWAGLLATSLGAWTETRRLRRGGRVATATANITATQRGAARSRPEQEATSAHEH